MAVSRCCRRNSHLRKAFSIDCLNHLKQVNGFNGSDIRWDVLITVSGSPFFVGIILFLRWKIGTRK